MKKGNPPLNKLRNRRRTLSMSTHDMSQRVGLSKSMYNYLETGKKRLSYEQAIKISEILNTTPDELFYEDYDEFFKNALI